MLYMLSLMTAASASPSLVEITNFSKNMNIATGGNGWGVGATGGGDWSGWPGPGTLTSSGSLGTTFAIVNDSSGNDATYIEAGKSLTVNLGLANAGTVYTLMSAAWTGTGQMTNFATVTFTGSAGATESFNLSDNVDMSDWAMAPLSSTALATSKVNAQVAWTSSNHTIYEQAFTLSSAFQSQTLVSMQITAINASGSAAPGLFGLDVQALPEPSSALLLGMQLACVAALGLSRRR